MTNAEILKYANENLWYLREGDYLPAQLSDINYGRGVENFDQLEEMRRLGTLYPTREVAMMVSERVRVLLSQASLECCCQPTNAKTEMKKEVLLFDDEAWTLCIINSTDTPRPITWKDTLKCVMSYINHGKGFIMCRVISVLRRAFTCSLKPRQMFSSE